VIFSALYPRMLENGATRQQVADVTGVDVKTIYKYLPAT
ncbi:TPA: helix-turn-helix domain-containing protein, partial [Klebsiella pneumoniae]